MHIGLTPDHRDDGKHCLSLGPTRLKPLSHRKKHVWFVVYPVHDIFPWIIDDNVTQGFPECMRLSYYHNQIIFES